MTVGGDLVTAAPGSRREEWEGEGGKGKGRGEEGKREGGKGEGGKSVPANKNLRLHPCSSRIEMFV